MIIFTLKQTLSALLVLVFLANHGVSYAAWEFQESGTTEGLYDVHFVDDSTGWAAGTNGAIIRTADGGQNWELLNSETSLHLYAVHFVDASMGWVAGSGGIILKTSDGGITWEEQYSEHVVHFRDIVFKDENTGWAVGNEILHTTDGGENWNSAHHPSFDGYLNDFYIMNDSFNVIVGDNGNIIYSDKMGFRNPSFFWSQVRPWQETEDRLQAAHFVDISTGWVIAQDGMIYFTSDTCKTWVIQPTPVSETLLDLQFLNNEAAWVVGRNGTILKTENKGENWELGTNLDIEHHLGAVFFTNSHTGWAVGENGTILHYKGDPLSVNKLAQQPIAGLEQNFPNPFGTYTNIQYNLYENSNVRLTVYNSTGKEVSVLVNSYQIKGGYEHHFDASDLSAGVYFYRLKTDNDIITRRMIINK